MLQCNCISDVSGQLMAVGVLWGMVAVVTWAVGRDLSKFLSWYPQPVYPVESFSWFPPPASPASLDGLSLLLVPSVYL